MEKARVFKNSKSQIVRLPRSAALPEPVKQVDVIIIGRARLLTPVDESWDSWFEGEGVTADFMVERDQPANQKRKRL